jgi:hypothetical protein
VNEVLDRMQFRVGSFDMPAAGIPVGNHGVWYVFGSILRRFESQ